MKVSSKAKRGLRVVLMMPVLLVLGAPSVAQTPASSPPAADAPRPPSVFDRPATNLTVMPATTTPDQLRGTMIAFSGALGVRCTHCHTGTEETPLIERDFASDANPKKAIARAMMSMTWAINTQSLAAIGGLTQPRVTCYSCHRGALTPALRAAPPVLVPTPPPPLQPPAPAPSGG